MLPEEWVSQLKKNRKENEFIELIKNRRSIRKWKPEIPKEEEIIRLIEAASYAPSGTNYQPWRFLVIKNNEVKKKMALAVERKLSEVYQKIKATELERVFTKYQPFFTFFQKAPIVLTVLYKPYPLLALPWPIDESNEEIDHRESVALQSASAATQNLLLVAHSLGLGGCWMDNPLIARRELEEILSVKSPWKLLALVPLGKPAFIPQPPRRKNLKAIMEIIN